jgi:hypothetical protein
MLAKRRTSGAKALISKNVYGTAEAVPFVQSFSLPVGTYFRDDDCV